MAETAEYRLYQDLAEWWALISPPRDWHEEEAADAALRFGLASGPVRDVLDLGCGGGNIASRMKTRFTLTLVDLSDGMLAVSRRLNPECKHVQGDMRDVRLGRTFDAVFVHDAVNYMTTEADLAKAIETAYVHCRPGGVAVFVPDYTSETFEAKTRCGGGDGADGRGARIFRWSFDPDPTDTWMQYEFVYLYRDGDNPVQVVHESHRLCLFSRATWLRLLAEAGFEPQMITKEISEDTEGREVFLGRRGLGEIIQ
jgi:SAM-dependent methyltransferase